MNDHRRLGRELDLFDTDPLMGAGLPYWLPDGATVRHTLEEYVRAAERRAGYQHVYSPVLDKRELYEISGHWAHYSEDMFPPMDLGGDADEDGEWAVYCYRSWAAAPPERYAFFEADALLRRVREGTFRYTASDPFGTAVNSTREQARWGETDAAWQTLLAALPQWRAQGPDHLALLGLLGVHRKGRGGAVRVHGARHRAAPQRGDTGAAGSGPPLRRGAGGGAGCLAPGERRALEAVGAEFGVSLARFALTRGRLHTFTSRSWTRPPGPGEGYVTFGFVPFGE